MLPTNDASHQTVREGYGFSRTTYAAIPAAL